MPRKSEWIHRIPAVLAILEHCPAPLLDRADIEKLLEVSPRQALRILHRLGATAVGKNLLIGREQLCERLRAVAAGEDVHYERRRLQRLDRTLAGLARDSKARAIPVRVDPDGNAAFPALPSAVRLRPGRLEIDFQTPEELLSRLYELSQAIANDYAQFERLTAASTKAASETG